MITAPALAPAPPGTALARSLAVPAAVLGGLLVVAGDAYHLFVLNDRPTQAGTAGYYAHGIALVLGLVLLVLAAPALARTSGRLTAVALPLLTLGSILVVGDVWAEVVVLPGVVQGTAPALLGEDIGGAHLALVVLAYAAFSLGWLLYAVAALRDRWVPRPVAALLAVGAVLAFLPIGGSYVLLSVGVAWLALRTR